MTGPSEKAIEAASQVRPSAYLGRVDAAVEAVHDPALGLDASVCVRNVVESLEGIGYQDAADFIRHKHEAK